MLCALGQTCESCCQEGVWAICYVAQLPSFANGWTWKMVFKEAYVARLGLFQKFSKGREGKNEVFSSPNIWFCILFAHLSPLESRGICCSVPQMRSESMTRCHFCWAFGALARKSNFSSGRRSRKRTWLWAVMGCHPTPSSSLLFGFILFILATAKLVNVVLSTWLGHLRRCQKLACK